MKRGQRMPWKVIYVWDNGIRGTIACPDEWTADHKAQQIRDDAERQDRTVTVYVEYREVTP